jgi:hypothetical protein
MLAFLFFDFALKLLDLLLVLLIEVFNDLCFLRILILGITFELVTFLFCRLETFLHQGDFFLEVLAAQL